jgi:hypothetical protein
VAEADIEGRKSDGSGTFGGLARALGAVLGVHIQYAQREAKDDMGRVIGGIALLVTAAVFVVFAILFGHLALAYYLASATKLSMMGAVGVVGAGDLALAIMLVLVGRGRLKKPVLKETRSLVKRTVESFADV